MRRLTDAEKRLRNTLQLWRIKALRDRPLYTGSDVGTTMRQAMRAAGVAVRRDPEFATGPSSRGLRPRSTRRSRAGAATHRLQRR